MQDSLIKNIINQICKKYSTIDTILLFGSALDDNWTPQSDIDLFFLDNNLSDKRIDLTIDGVKIEIQTDNFSNIKNYITEESGKLLNRNVSTMISTSQIIRSKSIKMTLEIIKLANTTIKSSVRYTSEDIKMWKYSITDYLAKTTKDLARKDTVAFYFDAHLVIQNVLELTLAKNNKYLPQPKRLASLLRIIAPSLLKSLQDYETTSNLENKLKILQNLAKKSILD